MEKLQQIFKQLLDDSEECGVCFDVLLSTNSAILPCRHAFHLQCLEEVIKTAPLCPMDRGTIDKTMFIEYQPPAEEDVEEEHKMQVEAATNTKSSAKIDKLVELLKLCDPDSKS